ncbi:unnamed protein product [Sphenostylis stenocarpa]|uniref:Uncharacterized protein n=1 Tax=Sphenostylis stenocarpa TaxID=92480 RepID=A0AA86VI66_9FABA|nr:unnamed protein product [Sphenostylis stenocarpa]
MRRVRFLELICLVLVLSAGSESRPLNPTIVRGVHGTLNWAPILPIAEEGGGERDAQRLSPGGPDPHHH